MSSNFREMSLEALKVELRRHGLAVSGRKKELIERLEFQQRNDLLKHDEPAPEFRMKKPDLAGYKDIHSDSELPKVNCDILADFLRLQAKELDMKMVQGLYLDTYLAYARFCKEGDTVYLHGKVSASMRRQVSYLVDASLTNDGAIKETQCECGVGMGPIATCKHTTLLIYALTEHTKKQPIRTQQTCTQTLQTFHTSKPHTGSPVKTEHLYPEYEKLLFDPRPADGRNKPSYQAHFWNCIVNFSASTNSGKMPVLQALPSANVNAVNMDHTYAFHGTPAERFLKSHGLIDLSAQDIKDIERKTQSQGLSRVWRQQRLFRMTASKFGAICKSTNPDQTLKQLMDAPDISHLPAVRHGLRNESVAVRLFEEKTGVTTAKCGLVVHKDYPYLAASPDRIAMIEGERVVIEVKCPIIKQDISEKTVPYLVAGDNGELILKHNHDYYFQIQGQLFCTDLQTAIFVIYTEKDLKSMTVPRDDIFIQQMCEQLKAFYESHFKPSIIRRYVLKEM